MIRLNKYIANSGICTRKEADVLISKGKIKVNHKVVNSLGFKVNKEDVVEYNGKVLKNEKLIYLALNKPKKLALSSFLEGISMQELSIAGEFNENITGLVVLTNDKALLSRLSISNAVIKQKYILNLKENLSEQNLKELKKGVTIDKQHVVFDEVNYGKRGTDKTELVAVVSFTKHELIFKAIKQMENEILYIDRVEFGGVKKGELARNKSRDLEPKEVGFLKMIKV